MGTRSNGSPPPPSRVKSKPLEVALEGEARLRMEKLLLERDLLVERKKNLQFRIDELGREADFLNKEVATNGRLRDEFITARGFDITQKTEYMNGKLSGQPQ